ncbi:hypothetical protein HDV05_007617 [Chytridiales sp. JEL 0842]|nr:hypothetical protein HDV05_007617 [Chytridiales sp. JEL 0842]
MTDTDTIVLTCGNKKELANFLQHVDAHRSVFNDCLYAVTALSEVMDTHPNLERFDLVNDYIDNRYKAARNLCQKLISPSKHESQETEQTNPHLRLYLATVAITTKKIISKASIANPCGPRGSPTPDDEDGASELPAGPQGKVCIGYALAVYNKQSRNLSLLDLVVRVPMLQSRIIEVHLLRALLEALSKSQRIRKEGGDRGSEGAVDGGVDGGVDGTVLEGDAKGLVIVPKRICMVLENSTTRWKGQMTKMGFIEASILTVKERQDAINDALAATNDSPKRSLMTQSADDGSESAKVEAPSPVTTIASSLLGVEAEELIPSRVDSTLLVMEDFSCLRQ